MKNIIKRFSSKVSMWRDTDSWQTTSVSFQCEPIKTNPIQQRSSWEVDSRSDFHEIPFTAVYIYRIARQWRLS
jgi:hypothetical protein